jgi:hypothetical protein
MNNGTHLPWQCDQIGRNLPIWGKNVDTNVPFEGLKFVTFLQSLQHIFNVLNLVDFFPYFVIGFADFLINVLVAFPDNF